MKRILQTASVILIATVISGCGIPEGEGVVGDILREAARTQIVSAFGEILKWTVLGFLSGAILAVGGYFLIRALGGYRWQWRHAVWFRRLTLVLLLSVCPLLLGQAGCAQGQLNGAEVVLRDSQVGKDLLPKAGEFGADLLIVIDWFTLTSELGVLIPALPEAELTQFRKGESKLDVVALIRRIDRLTEGASEKLVRLLKDEALKRNPQWKGATGEKVLDWLLPKLADRLLEKKRSKVVEGLRPFLQDLEAEAAIQLDSKMSRAQVSAFLVDRVMVPTLLSPVRSIVRGVQKVALIVVGLVLLLPVVFFRSAEFMRARGTPDTPEPGPRAVPRDPTANLPSVVPVDPLAELPSVVILDEDREKGEKQSG